MSLHYRLEQILEALTGVVLGVSVNAGGSLIASTGHDKTVRLWAAVKKD